MGQPKRGMNYITKKKKQFFKLIELDLEKIKEIEEEVEDMMTEREINNK